MSLPVLLLLSFLAVQCGGCDFDWEVVKNVKITIDSNPAGFRTVFPKDYHVKHHYESSMLCDSDPCCGFPAAVVLQDSWEVVLQNLWDEHLNYSFIVDLKQTLDRIIKRNRHTERFQEETDVSSFPSISSSPEELLNLTSQLFSWWLKVGCSAHVETCSLPALAARADAERAEHPPLRARLLTTRAVSSVEEGLSEKMLDATRPPSNSGPPSLPTPASVLGPLFFGLCQWLLPW